MSDVGPAAFLFKTIVSAFGDASYSVSNVKLSRPERPAAWALVPVFEIGDRGVRHGPKRNRGPAGPLPTPLRMAMSS
jgi:hypothetical protein